MSELQVEDDIDLLELMMSDHARCAAEYQWTNYWSKKSKMLLGYLQSTGLKDFRRNRDPKGTPGAVLNSFGAVDLISPAFTGEALYSRADAAGKEVGAVPLANLSVSQAGNPESFEIDGGTYTHSWLNFYMRYAYARRFFTFNNSTIVEIGPRSGKQAELIKKAHPDSTLLLFDIPPMLYVCNQYLKSALPNDVVDYRDCRDITSHTDIRPGKIHIFANWSIGLTRDTNIDLLWNAASFQEMEPEIVRNYLSYAGHSAQSVYLMELMYGQSVAERAGKGGVLEKTWLKHYIEFLPEHEIIDLRRASLAQPTKIHRYRYSDTFWQRPVTS